MKTVKELIEILESMPEDAPVILGYTPLQEVYIDEEFYFADTKDPTQSIGTAVILE